MGISFFVMLSAGVHATEYVALHSVSNLRCTVVHRKSATLSANKLSSLVLARQASGR